MTSLRCLGAFAFSAAYLALIGWNLAGQGVGGGPASPFASFFTWDMFPDYDTELVRRVVVAETTTGRRLKLIPGPRDRFRWGVQGDAFRTDLDRRDATLIARIESELARQAADAADRSGDPIVRVMVLENVRPARLPSAVEPVGPELPFPLETFDPAAATDHWRRVAEAQVDSQRRLAWKPLR